MTFIGRLILRRILKSALVFEREARGLYEALQEELGEEAHGGLGHLIEEERMHHRVLEDIAEGRLDGEALERMLASHRYHALEETGKLPEAALLEHRERLEQALRDEEATVSFYANLERIGRIPAVKLAFRALADMEREHVAILRRLLGAPSPPGGVTPG